MVKYTKKINATDTQRASYAQIKDSPTALTESKKVKSFLTKSDEAHSRRQMQEVLGLKINHMTRVINDFKRDDTIQVVFKKKCEYTGVRVEFYGLTSKEYKTPKES